MKTILVVDDSASVRKLLEDYLTEAGFRVAKAPLAPVPVVVIVLPANVMVPPLAARTAALRT